mmetsp:Transcript_68378/g.222417  ORF Transcript_68378/g.222417 Transcript_68378/m.222417 type:complete len:452 (-) Transcript_68378:761-2116(-)
MQGSIVGRVGLRGVRKVHGLRGAAARGLHPLGQGDLRPMCDEPRVRTEQVLSTRSGDSNLRVQHHESAGRRGWPDTTDDGDRPEGRWRAAHFLQGLQDLQHRVRNHRSRVQRVLLLHVQVSRHGGGRLVTAGRHCECWLVGGHRQFTGQDRLHCPRGVGHPGSGDDERHDHDCRGLHPRSAPVLRLAEQLRGPVLGRVQHRSGHGRIPCAGQRNPVVRDGVGHEARVLPSQWHAIRPEPVCFHGQQPRHLREALLRELPDVPHPALRPALQGRRGPLREDVHRRPPRLLRRLRRPVVGVHVPEEGFLGRRALPDTSGGQCCSQCWSGRFQQRGQEHGPAGSIEHGREHDRQPRRLHPVPRQDVCHGIRLGGLPAHLQDGPGRCASGRALPATVQWRHTSEGRWVKRIAGQSQGLVIAGRCGRGPIHRDLLGDLDAAAEVFGGGGLRSPGRE